MERDLIDWKTDAWKNPGMVAWYHRRMVENRGSNRLKNEVEVELCRRFAVGKKVLDVGIGTGRASLPLARDGYVVTGVDSSQAMLDQTRALAAASAAPITLLQRDVAELGFADGEFDTLMSLNVMVHFPHWRDILAEWKRVVRADGRIVFDIHSQDHEDAVCAAKGLPPRPDSSEDFGNYSCRIRVEELAETASALGLRIAAVVPYSGLFSGGNPNLWLKHTLADGTRFDRLLSWLSSDQALFDFALFIEREVFAHLTSVSTGRFMVVLDRSADAESATESNQRWLARDRELNRLLASQPAASELAHLVPAFDEGWRGRLNSLLDWPRNRVLMHFLLSAWRDFPGRLDPVEWLDQRHARALLTWRHQDALDQVASGTLHDLAALPELSTVLSHRGIPLAGGLEYDLTRELIAFLATSVNPA
ncbi:MAG: hypothetical protein B7Y41_01020 [Hydrogenophilales bacterium 28-61-23]|nr:MAG: hypothetical protein B7Y41_01020 [Hydrogenophilales bacterium 28-61-23]